jgi:excisionase family DNA binding protein
MKKAEGVGRDMSISVDDELMSVRQAAAFVGIKEAGMRAWIHRRTIPYTKVGRLVRIRRSSLETLLQRGEVPANIELQPKPERK